LTSSSNRPRPRRRLAADPGWLFAGLSLLLATATLVTTMFIWKAGDDRHTLASGQTAASSAARSGIEKLLAYDYRTFDRHTNEVSALLTGRFRIEFVQATTRVVKPLAVKNQAVVRATVSKASVMSTPGTPDPANVKILLFVDQHTTSAKLDRPQVDQNRVILTMSQVDGRWLVSKIEAF
jgi:Mce-associated membrane protein